MLSSPIWCRILFVFQTFPAQFSYVFNNVQWNCRYILQLMRCSLTNLYYSTNPFSLINFPNNQTILPSLSNIFKYAPWLHEPSADLMFLLILITLLWADRHVLVFAHWLTSSITKTSLHTTSNAALGCAYFSDPLTGPFVAI